ncbi:hypothetical protein M0802_014839 [Mischocyttarus mexicanus]|nr:hypothetical protein M0802_014839 [Mischocyttarus mexicanus]
MEVGIRYGVCNNSPAEATRKWMALKHRAYTLPSAANVAVSTGNKPPVGCRYEALTSRRVAAVCAEGSGREPAWSRRRCRS